MRREQLRATAETFPLVPSRRVAGAPFGTHRSLRRGAGTDVAGSRLYAPGDPVAAIDWRSSARLSSARSSDEFIVREHFADEAPRVVVVADRRPAMSLYQPPFPWLSKPAALAAATRAIAASALASQAELGYLDYAGHEARRGRPYWLSFGSRQEWRLVRQRHAEATPFDAPDDNLERSLDFLRQRRGDLPRGTFVFVLSDFLGAFSPETWLRAVGNRWDLVPVVIQDPVWEQSFPEVDSLVVPFAEPDDGRVVSVRLRRHEVREKRRANEERLRALLDRLARLGLDPVLLGTSDPGAVVRAFLVWAQRRRRRARRMRR